MLNKQELIEYFAVATALFLLAGLLGFISAQMYFIQSEEVAKSVFEPVKEILQSSYNTTKKLAPEDSLFPIILFFTLSFLIIFVNNTVKSFIAMVSGVFLGIIPVFFLFINGFIIGLVVFVSGKEVGYVETIARIIPHGIFEIPAIILACSYGLWLGKSAFLSLKKKDVELSSRVKYAVSRFCKVVLPALLVAAIIEAALLTILVFSEGNL